MGYSKFGQQRHADVLLYLTSFPISSIFPEEFEKKFLVKNFFFFLISSGPEEFQFFKWPVWANSCFIQKTPFWNHVQRIGFIDQITMNFYDIWPQDGFWFFFTIDFWWKVTFFKKWPENFRNLNFFHYFIFCRKNSAGALVVHKDLPLFWKLQQIWEYWHWVLMNIILLSFMWNLKIKKCFVELLNIRVNL